MPSPQTTTPPDLRFFLVFHYFRSKQFQSFLKSLNSRPLLIFPGTLRSKGLVSFYSSLISPLAGFSLVVSFSSFSEAALFYKVLKSHPRAGFILFFCFEGVTFFPQELPKVLEFYQNAPSSSLVIRPITALVLNHQRQMQAFFLQFFLQFFRLFIKKPISHANVQPAS